jgi:hypothetical protein
MRCPTPPMQWLTLLRAQLLKTPHACPLIKKKKKKKKKKIVSWHMQGIALLTFRRY